MSKRKTTRKKKATDGWQQRLFNWLAAIDDDTRRTIARSTLKSVVVLTLIGGAALALTNLRSRVIKSQHESAPVYVLWTSEPDWLPGHVIDALNDAVHREGDLDLLNPTLTRAVADRLSASGWVDKVRRVEIFANGRLEIDCQFREPIAVVQQSMDFYLVDRKGVRLPGLYDGPGELPLIQGVRSPAPQPGEEWTGEDFKAGISLAGRLVDQIFAFQVAGVSVDNFGGRQNPAKGHIKIHTLPERYGVPGGVIIWGSAIGQEAEEPSADDKMALLAANWQQTGRIDAGLAWIDISISRSQYRTDELAVIPNRPKYP